ncbi:hypothetical protein [Brevundimonas sp.]|uniref:hypothetical protein n=1 Tax=Brevundimonas sp. TaxID=1871086 RepID=UPI003F6EF580
MTPEFSFSALVVLPIALGLFGFVEPCSLGSTLIFVKHMEGKGSSTKLFHTLTFALIRAVFIGLLGLGAVLAGAAFFGFQRAAWLLLGVAYLVLGFLYISGKAGAVMISIGPRLTRLSGARGAAGLGLLFGLNIPACAAPLVFVLLGMAAAGGASGATLAHGFISLALFGLALSLPLIVAVFFAPARRALDWLAGISRRLPFWTGVLMVTLGGWSIWMAFTSRLTA